MIRVGYKHVAEKQDSDIFFIKSSMKWPLSEYVRSEEDLLTFLSHLISYNSNIERVLLGRHRFLA